MILVSNHKVNADSIIDKYPPNSLEKDIVSKMALSNEYYQYSYLNQFNFEVNLRVNIIKAAKELPQSKISFKTFDESSCNKDYWSRDKEGGFILKDKVTPTDGINDIYIHGSKYGTECSTAITIIYYKALLNTYEEKLFNQLFPKIHLLNWHYLPDIISEIGYMKKEVDYIPGDRRYFKNPDSDPKKPEWIGENVIDLNNEIYFGHGIGIKSSTEMILILNKYRKKDPTESAYLVDTVSRPNFKYLANIYYNYIS